MVFDSTLNFIFGPLLKMPVLWAVIFISFIISLIITLVYKFMTDQDLMKSLKTDMKKHSDEMKLHKNDPNKMMESQKKVMEVNMKYMMHSMKPTLITFLPIIIIFGWFNAHLVYEPIMPGAEFTTTLTFEKGLTGEASLISPEGISLLSNTTQKIEDGKIMWVLKGDEGEYIINYAVKDKEYTKDLLITSKQEYKPPVKIVKDGVLDTIKIDQKELKPLNLFGWKLGWLGTYIIFSIVSSMLLRKILKVH
jgi:uncharacterized membrane protein (DUF106 family)